MYYVADSHSLVWYLTEDKKIVLAEIIHICEKKKANLEIREVINKIKHSFNLDIETLEKVISLKGLSELHDGIIVATAKLLYATLITKDQQIIDSKIVKTIW